MNRNRLFAFVLVALALLPAVAKAELPPRGDSVDPQVWGGYTVDLIGQFAADADLKGVRVRVAIATEGRFAQENFLGAFGNDGIMISVPAVRFFSSEKEYRIALAHELAHLVLRHQKTDNAQVSDRHEFEADDWVFALMPAPEVPCIYADYLTRVAASKGTRWSFGSAEQRRIARDRELCKERGATVVASNN